MHRVVQRPVDWAARIVKDGRFGRIELNGSEPVSPGRHRRAGEVEAGVAAVGRSKAEAVLAASVDHVLINGIDQRLLPVAADVGVPSRPSVGTVGAIVLGSADQPVAVLLAYVYAVELCE